MPLAKCHVAEASVAHGETALPRVPVRTCSPTIPPPAASTTADTIGPRTSSRARRERLSRAGTTNGDTTGAAPAGIHVTLPSRSAEAVLATVTVRLAGPPGSAT